MRLFSVEGRGEIRKSVLKSIRDTGFNVLVAHNQAALFVSSNKHELLVCARVELMQRCRNVNVRRIENLDQEIDIPCSSR
jgi:hypothetical protein